MAEVRAYNLMIVDFSLEQVFATSCEELEGLP